MVLYEHIFLKYVLSSGVGLVYALFLFKGWFWAGSEGLFGWVCLTDLAALLLSIKIARQ